MTDAIITRRDTGDIAILTYDVPGQPVNTVSEESLDALAAHVTAIAEDPQIAAAVLVSGKADGFCAGADIKKVLPALQAMEDARPAVARLQDALRTVLDSPKPVVAAIHGAAMGGGAEIALACQARVASDAEGTQIGLPEVQLGLLPAGGGTQTLPRVLPAEQALDLLLSGRALRAQEARKTGLVDRVAPPDVLREAAIAHARDLASGAATRAARPPALDEAALTALARQGQALAEQRSRGIGRAHHLILAAFLAGLRDGLDAGLAQEREGFAELLRSDEAAAALHLFDAREQAVRAARRGAPKARKLFILGGGMMGAGLAATAVGQGMDARVRDLHESALAGVHRATEKFLAGRHDRRRAAGAPEPQPSRYGRLSTTGDYSGIGAADVVVEAVFEDLELKHRVIREAEAGMAPGAMFATNTSAIPIADLAVASARPEAFVGMHFFSPVERMALVEVIPHAGTSEETLARALSLTRQLGKVPVVVGDAPGFYTSRVISRWLVESVALLLDGARIEDVDDAATALGFPVGPLVIQDEVSLQLVRRAQADALRRPLEQGRVDLRAVQAGLDALMAGDHAGRRYGRGYYRYGPDGRRVGPDADVYDVLREAVPDATPAERGEPGRLSSRQVRERLLWAFTGEALHCWDEGLLRSTSDGDLAAVLGIGFPANLGGPFHYVDRVGPGQALERLAALAEELPASFHVPAGLRERASGG